MNIFVNGFWPGFMEKTNGVHFGVFEFLFKSAFSTEIGLSRDLKSADVLLESHFAPSVLHLRQWDLSIFFSGEGSIPLPNHHSEYTIVLGAQMTSTNCNASA
jgi:hypothetical protein